MQKSCKLEALALVWQNKNEMLGLGISSVVQNVLSICESLSSTPSTTKKIFKYTCKYICTRAHIFSEHSIALILSIHNCNE
jgi:hypothetical protein